MFLLFFQKLFCFCERCFVIDTFWATTSISLTSPLPFDGIGLPWIREYFPHTDFSKLLQEVNKIHPPGAINFFSFGNILKLIFNSFIFFPLISFFTERPSPNPFIAPRIPNSDKFKIIFRKIPHIYNSIIMILEYPLLPLFRILSISALNHIDTS